MSRLNINIGTTANDRTGDPLRTAFEKVNANFTELYDALGTDGQYDRLTSGNKTIVLDSNGVLTFPNNETLVSQTGQLYFHKENNNYVGEIVLQAGSTGLLANHPDIGSGTFIVNPNSVTLSINDNEWGFNNVGTLTTPLLLPKTFTAVLDTAHMVTPVALTDTPWEFVVEFQVNPDGTVQTMIGNNTPFVSNPGYVDGYTFEYTEADHGIPDYTFTLEMYDVINPGPAGWTTNLAASIPPEYPSTISSQGAIKLTSDTNSWTFGTTGVLTLPASGTISNTVNGSSFTATTATGLPGDTKEFAVGGDVDTVTTSWTATGGGIVGTAAITNVTVGLSFIFVTFDQSFTASGPITFTSAGVGSSLTITPDGTTAWTFSTDGALTLPGGATQQSTGSVNCQAGVDTVVFTSSQAGIHTIKLLLKVEGVVTAPDDADTQSCEMIVAKGFRGPTVAASVYGLVYTSVAPLATFTAQWNATTSRVEVTCRPTSLTNSVEVKSFATEITTSD